MSNFKIGEKVVCVSPADQLIKGEIYTIRGIYNSTVKPELKAFLLEEIQGRYSEVFKKEIGFNSNRFRKLDHQFAEDICAELIADAKRETILN